MAEESFFWEEKTRADQTIQQNGSMHFQLVISRHDFTADGFLAQDIMRMIRIEKKTLALLLF